jgi:hypothetical protein
MKISVPSGRGGGPRTALGKERSKFNARTHGIFSKIVVLKGESQAEYDSLLDGFREYFRPVGPFEEGLVEILAVTRWRQRRPLIAEGAEIEAGKALVEWDEKVRTMIGSTNIQKASGRRGLARKIEDAEALDVSIERLGVLQLTIEDEGIDYRRDRATLDDLYGELDQEHWQLDLHYFYQGIAVTTGLPEGVLKQRGLPSSEESKRKLLKLVDDEMRRLRCFQTERVAFESKRTEVEALRQVVPTSSRLDNLVKYSAHLDRTFDRTFNQLDRAQRIRLGKPIAPRIDMNISHS